MTKLQNSGTATNFHRSERKLSTFPYRCFDSRSPCNENIGDALQHRLALLIAQIDLVANDSPVGFRLRFALLQNGRFEIKLVPRTYRVRQLQLIPTHSGKDSELRLKPASQQDENRERVGA